MIRIENMEYAYNNVHKYSNRNHFWMTIGFLEACLLHFGIIQNSDLKVYKKTVKRRFRKDRDEFRDEMIMRMSKEYLESQNLLK